MNDWVNGYNLKNFCAGARAKLLAFCIFLVGIFAVFVAVAPLKPLLIGKNQAFNGLSGSYTYYLYSKSSNAKMVTVSLQNAKSTRFFLTDVRGESLLLTANTPSLMDGAQQFALQLVNDYRATLQICESGAEFNNFYYYSPKIGQFVVINGKKVNLHISYSSTAIVLGSPLIFGSY